MVLPESALSLFLNLVLQPIFERFAHPTFGCEAELIYDPLISVGKRTLQIIKRATPIFQYQPCPRNPQWFTFLPESSPNIFNQNISPQ